MVLRGLFIGMLLCAVCLCFAAGCAGDPGGDGGPLSVLPNDSLVTGNDTNRIVVPDIPSPKYDADVGCYRTYARRGPENGTEITIESVGELHAILQNSTYGLVSAGPNPSLSGETDLPPEFFTDRHEQLREELIGMGYCFTEVLGNYDGFEDTFLVMTNESGRGDMISLGYLFSQESVIHVVHGKQEMIYTCDAVDTDTGVFIPTGTIVTGEGYAEVGQEETNYYTEVTFSDGSQYRFSLNFDWDNPVSPSCHVPMTGHLVRMVNV